MQNSNYIPKQYAFAKNLSEKEYFIYACFCKDLQEFYTEWIDQKRDRLQLFNQSSIPNKLIHNYWNPSNICCESGVILTPETIDVKISYWIPQLWKPIHKDLLKQSRELEVFECQKVDCSCNDCIYFDRNKLFCNKLNVTTNRHSPNTCYIENRNCFKHRKEK